MDQSKQLLRDVASEVYELDLLLPATEPSSSSTTNGSAPPPPSSTEAPNSTTSSSQEENNGNGASDQEKEEEEGERSRTPTVDASGLGSEEEQKPFVREDQTEEVESFVYQEETSLEVGTSPVDSKDFVQEEESPLVAAEDTTADFDEAEARETSQEVLKD